MKLDAGEVSIKEKIPDVGRCVYIHSDFSETEMGHVELLIIERLDFLFINGKDFQDKVHINCLNQLPMYRTTLFV